MLVVPRWATSCVDGSFGGAQQRRLRFTLTGGPLSGRKTHADRGKQSVQRSLTASTLNEQTHSRSQDQCLEPARRKSSLFSQFLNIPQSDVAFYGSYESKQLIHLMIYKVDHFYA